jgi:tripartite-type tricarboxylate transporter receptor subunit TctC
MFSRLSVAIAFGFLTAFSCGPLLAQDYPTRPVTIVVAQPPGGGTDIIARIIANQLSIQMGQPVVVENRAGAGTVVGTMVVANSAPDGYTLITGLTANMAVNPSLFAKLSYDPIRDFTPVGMLAEFPFAVVVNKDFPAHSIKELIELAKAKPGVINFASGGNGTGQHLSTELFELEAGIKMTHVPYRGIGAAYPDVLSGKVQLAFSSIAGAVPFTGSNQLRALATTGSKRSPVYPHVPTVAETLPGFEVDLWIGVYAPAGMPAPVLARLSGEINKVLERPDLKSAFATIGIEPRGTTPEEGFAFTRSEFEKWRSVIIEGKIQSE